MQISKNKVVQIHYTLSDPEGRKLDSSEGRDPLAYIQGVGALIPGLESELEGKAEGEKLKAVIPPAKAYGDWEKEKQFVVPKSGFKGDEELKVGMRVQVDTGQGQSVGFVSAMEGDNVTLDMNHPLAGVTLHFDVEVVGVREATEDELQHGHAHGPGGHQH